MRWALKGRCLAWLFIALVLLPYPASGNSRLGCSDNYFVVNEVFSMNKDRQGFIQGQVKSCLKDALQNSFWFMGSLDNRSQYKIFYDVSEDERNLIILLNGIDLTYLSEFDFISNHPGILKNIDIAKRKLRHLLRKYKIKLENQDCETLANLDSCYEPVRQRLNLPTVEQIIRRVRFKLR